MRDLLGRRRVVIAAAALALLALVVLALHLTSPRTSGVEGDWTTRAPGGASVAGRAVLLDDNASLDLRTGKTVTLGSVRGGTPYVADDRLIIASPARLDSARLDATARWTWRAPAGSTVSPLAASGGGTIASVCPATGPCRLVGLDAAGRESWSADGEQRRAPLPSGPLPKVDAVSAGGGVRVTDPSGRSSLQPGRSFLAVPDGPVVTEVVQDGRCVVAAFQTADPAWTQVLPACPAGTPRLSVPPVDPDFLTVAWPSDRVRLELRTGAQATTNVTAGKDTTIVLRTSGLIARETRKSLHTNPFRWGTRVTVLQIVPERASTVRAQVVSDERLTLLHLDASSLVVRDGDEVVRYTID
ncbi:hypothetical protein SAMN04489867_2572 [Pedococcus dokdonensis]|uniref:PQQ-like domain-containing protein n=1 Tax=Pedococcus dokdonensis TaxID=443156 RepID=A0A1H0SZM6_9MICO|nr:hypothetical protein [Pedococcus dokdonensis]SDP47164.1 hypothetical protein SAMN04489867_2572 [Pedococcus dokdonensis]